MSVVNELINAQGESLEFGNYELGAKTKKDGFEFQGDIYKIKTFNEITKLEKNGMFVYESVPGTAVHGFKADENDVTFVVEGPENASITLELEPETEYKVHVDDVYVGKENEKQLANVRSGLELKLKSRKAALDDADAAEQKLGRELDAARQRLSVLRELEKNMDGYHDMICRLVEQYLYSYVPDSVPLVNG